MTARSETTTELRLVPDSSVRTFDEGKTLIGGSPWRVLKLSGLGAQRVDAWMGGSPVEDSPAARSLALRLLDRGLAHPWWSEILFSGADVTAVIPVKDDAAGLSETCRALRSEAGPAVTRIIVVDDGSADADAVRRAAGSATVIRFEQNRGPGAARNASLAHLDTPLAVFVDADVSLGPGWLLPLLAHFNDERVAAVAPRVKSAVSLERPGVIERYEDRRSPLDLGPEAARVEARTRVSYVPTACLIMRTPVDPFDEALRYGEDVDLVWRLRQRGAVLRYEPASVVTHRPRSTLAGFARQRFGYASASAPLSKRHPGAVVPVAVSAWSATAWGLAALGQPAAGLAVAGVSTALLPRKLTAIPHPVRRSIGLAGRGHLGAGGQLASATTRSWWPLALAGALGSRRIRRAVAAAALLPAMTDWVRTRPPLDPVRYLGMRLLDDVSYGAGLWWSCLRHRTIAPLLPDLGSWPGRGPSVAEPGVDRYDRTGDPR